MPAPARTGGDGPVIFLSARSELPDRLAAFRAGGDDYLVKPFELEELLVRVRALLRRGDSGLSQPRDDGVSLDPGAHAVVHRGQHISLTPTEFQLLAALTSAQPSGTALNRAALCAAAWPDSEEVSANALDSCLARLRAKLARAGAPDAIVTVRGFGYALR